MKCRCGSKEFYLFSRCGWEVRQCAKCGQQYDVTEWNRKYGDVMLVVGSLLAAPLILPMRLLTWLSDRAKK